MCRRYVKQSEKLGAAWKRDAEMCVCVCVCVCVDRDTEDECEEVDEDVPTTKQSRAGQREDNAAESTADSRSVVPGTFAASVAVEAGGSAVGATACRGGRRDSELEGVGKEDCEECTGGGDEPVSGRGCSGRFE